jgi:hypothetical protein
MIFFSLRSFPFLAKFAKKQSARKGISLREIGLKPLLRL